MATAAPILPYRPPYDQPRGHPLAAFIAALVRVVALYHLTNCWTLTLSTHSCSAEESDRYAMQSWARLRRALWHHYGAFAYVGLPERTARGYVHLNVYASVRISEADLAVLWCTASRGSDQVAVRRVRDDRLAHYLMKQLKGCLSIPSERGGWWFSSQGIHLTDFIPDHALARAQASRASMLDYPPPVKLVADKPTPPESARAAAPLSRQPAERVSGVPTLSTIQPLTADEGTMDPGAQERKHIAAAAIVATTLLDVGDPPTTRAAGVGGLRAALERAQEAGTLPASLRPLLLAKRAAAPVTPRPRGAPPDDLSTTRPLTVVQSEGGKTTLHVPRKPGDATGCPAERPSPPRIRRLLAGSEALPEPQDGPQEGGQYPRGAVPPASPGPKRPFSAQNSVGNRLSPPHPTSPVRTQSDIVAEYPKAPCPGGCGQMTMNGWTCRQCVAPP